MQPQLRKEKDGDLQENYVTISDFKSEMNQFQIDCSSCGKFFYTDKANYDHFVGSIEQGLDNPFVCPECQAEYEDLEYSER